MNRIRTMHVSVAGILLAIGVLTLPASVHCATSASSGAAAGAEGAERRSALFIEVGIVSMGGVPWNLEDNFRRLEKHVREAARRRAQLVIAPESILDGYIQGADPDVTRERMLEVAQTVPDGPYLRRAAALCRELGIYLVFGFLAKSGSELFNSLVLLDPAGAILAKYNKVFPSGESYITPGRELKTFDTPLGRIGFLICSDRHIVDNFSTLGVQGAQIILLPMDGAGGPQNTAVLRQRARDNQCAIVVANTWSSAIINSRGDAMLENYETESVVVGRIFFDAPSGRGRDKFHGRRPDLYGPLTDHSLAGTLFDERGRPTAEEEAVRQDQRERLKIHEQNARARRESGHSPHPNPGSSSHPARPPFAPMSTTITACTGGNRLLCSQMIPHNGGALFRARA